MTDIETSEREGKGLTKAIWLGVGVLSLLLIAGLIYLKSRPEPPAAGPAAQPQLQGAIRAGSPEFKALVDNIRLDAPEATQDQTALGGLSMNLFTTVRNFTGKTITGLELKGTVVDIKKNPVKERTVIVIPDRQPTLENSRALPVRIRVEGFKDTDDRANIDIQITGVIVQ